MADNTIILGIARSAGNAVSGGPKASGLTPELRQKILERDKYSCRYCGFVSQKYQDVHFPQ